MKMFRILRARASALALLAGAACIGHDAQAQSFTIKPRVEHGQDARIALERLIDFEQTIVLRVKTDPARIPSARLLEIIRALDLKDGAGLSVRRGWGVDTEHDLVIAWAGGTAEISRVRQSPAGLEVAALFRDHQGRITVPPEGSLAAYTTDGQRLCFDEEIREVPVQSYAPAPLLFTILIDRSGSMLSVSEEVTRAARSFIADLPESAECALGGFATSWSFGPAGIEARACRPENFTFEFDNLGGGTALYEPLRETLEWMNDPRWAGHQRAVIIITDGAINGSHPPASTLLPVKGETLSFVYYLGFTDQVWLRDFADNYLHQSADLTGHIEPWLNVVSEAFVKQRVLRISHCPRHVAE